MADPTQPMNPADLFSMIKQARSGPAQAVQGGLAGGTEGVNEALASRAQALKEKVEALNAVPGGEAQSIINGEPKLNPNREYGANIINAGTMGGYRQALGLARTGMAGAAGSRADTAAKAEAEKERHNAVGEGQGQAKLDEKTMYDQGTLAARDAGLRAKAAPTLTQSSRGSAEFAGSLLPHLDDFESLVHQAAQKGLIGPAAGRLNSAFLAGKVGTTGNPETDELLGQMKSEAMLLASGMTRMHFGSRGGQQIVDKFATMTDVNKLSEPILKGDLKTMRAFATGYQHLQPVPATGLPNPTPPSAAPATSLPAPTPPVGGAGAAPQTVTIRASDGSTHRLPAQNLDKAKQRDPGLQVIQ